MATVKKSKKKKIIVLISLVLVVALIITSVVIYKKQSKIEKVSLYTIGTGDIYENVNSTGEIASGTTKDYKVGTVATVKEVFVSVGDKVKEGDKLATFDTEGLQQNISKLQSTYNTAKSDYNTSVKNQKIAKSNLSAVQSRIPTVEKQVQELREDALTTTKAKATTKRPTTTQKATTTTKKATTTTTTTTTTATDTTSTTASSGSSMGQLADAVTELAKTMTELSDNVAAQNELLNVISSTIAEEVANGNLSADAIGNAVGDAVARAFREGIIEETQYLVESGALVDMVTAAVKAIDWNEIVTDFSNSTNVSLTTKELQLAILRAEEIIYQTASSSSPVSAKKQIMDASYDALQTLKEANAELTAGWTAEFDGTITSCDITPGEQTTMLSKGITLQNLDKMIVTISLGEYDIHKVKVGMDATITTAYGKYTGEILSKAPIATGGSDTSILDSVGSMAGISGLSSLTASGAGVECTVSVDSPDDNIIAGFDADVEISTGNYLGVTVVPIESIQLEKTGTYVYVYNDEEKTVTKTLIQTGAISDTYYQVTDGINVGDKVVSTPSSTYTDDTFKVKVVDKTTTDKDSTKDTTTTSAQ